MNNSINVTDKLEYIETNLKDMHEMKKDFNDISYNRYCGKMKTIFETLKRLISEDSHTGVGPFSQQLTEQYLSEKKIDTVKPKNLNFLEDTCPKTKGKCTWTWADGYYKTECDEAFEITAGTPEDNRFKFCPYCGEKIQIEE